MAETVGNEEGPELPSGTQSSGLCPPLPAPAGTARQGIVIQLTGTEGEWDSLEDNELIFTLEGDEDGSSAASSRQRLCREASQPDQEWGLRSPVFHVPLSPSSPGSLGDLSSASIPCFLSPGLASPTHRPPASLVKSHSTELELQESPSSSLRPRPLLSLVKSISTELSRSEPEVSQSKSDSKLNLHLWKQLTQPKGRNGDSRTAPPSPVSLSPSEPKAGFFKMELEDTRRKFTEAMQEPLSSMFSKIMREDSIGSPKLHRAPGSVDSPSYKVFCGAGGKSRDDSAASESSMRSAKRSDCDSMPVFHWPAMRDPRKALQRTCLSHEHHRLGDMGPMYEISTHGEVMQVVEVNGHRGSAGPPTPGQLSSPVPGMGLFCVAALSYSYFVLPLPSYWSGLFLGLAFGFMLGLLLVRLGSARCADYPHRGGGTQSDNVQSETLLSDAHILKGWMNEMYTYDPETYHPSLTHSVYATLEGPCLQLDYPRNNISRWATFDQLPPEAVFIRSRRFQLAGSKVFLLPSALARKRVWNKKYPICIALAEEEEGEEEERAEEAEGEAQDAGRPPLSVSKVGRPSTLYLFGRTGREKEEWFHHFLSASMPAEDEDKHSRCGSRPDVFELHDESPSCPVQFNGESSMGSTEDIASVPLCPRDLAGRVKENIPLDYTTYMASLITSQHASPCHSSAEGSPTDRCQKLCYYADETQPVWINALIGRIFWDFLREKYWVDQVSLKIQRKLSKIRLPYFMNELKLTELDMGSGMPQITGTSKPQVSRRGLWLELQVEYTGALQMTLETKINLSKLGKEGGFETDSAEETGSECTRSRLSVLADSDEESSSAGSSDEEELQSTEPQGSLGEKGTPPVAEGAAGGGGKTGRRILRFVDKIAKSKYFQKATENEYIKKKIEEMSNTPLLLTVEVQELSGTLAVNIPPPPTDRIWYSFCGPPRLDLRVRPKLGEREVTFCHVTEWIEKKLQDEFQKVFVFPNMDDIYLPLMHSGMDNPPASQQPLAPSSCNSPTDSMENISQEHAAELE